MKEPPAKAVIQQKLPPKLQAKLALKDNPDMNIKNNLKKQASAKSRSDSKKKLVTEEEEKYFRDNQVLTLQVEALQITQSMPTPWKRYPACLNSTPVPMSSSWVISMQTFQDCHPHGTGKRGYSIISSQILA